MITALDKQNFLQLQEQIDPNQAMSMFKILAQFVENMTPSNVLPLKQQLNSNENVLVDWDETKELLQTMLKEIADIAAQESTTGGKTYTTGELARYFGVSITTINNWINNGKFIGVERTEPNQQLRISENTLFHYLRDDYGPVREVVESWERQQIEMGVREISDEEEKKEVLEEIEFFEKKYGGSYEMTLGAKTTKTRDEYWDASAWEFLLRVLRSLE